jgi:hypothetical protein
MVTYQRIENEVSTYIQRTLDGVVSFIPINLANTDYQEYLKYLEDNK